MPITSARPSGPLRTTLKRKAKKVEIEIVDSFDAKAWRDYEVVYQSSWKPSEGKPAMLRRFAEQEGAAARLRLGIARSGGRAVAAQFWTVEDGTAFIHKLAHVDEAVPISAGTVLTAALFERVIDTDDVHMVDFGTGDDPYKSMWMEETRTRYRLEVLRPGRPATWLRPGESGLPQTCLRKRRWLEPSLFQGYRDFHEQHFRAQPKPMSCCARSCATFSASARSRSMSSRRKPGCSAICPNSIRWPSPAC